MHKKEIILIGGGGHCKSCIDVIEQEGEYQIKGIIDLPSELGKTVLDYKVIANDEEIVDFIKEGYSFLITIGHLGSPKLRTKLFNLVKENKGYLPVIVSPNAYISKHTKIDKGCIIMHNALINAATKIGENCIVNSKALIEHDVIIGKQTHISTGAIVNGNVEIGENCFIGSGTVIRNNSKLSSDIIIGAGSVVTKNITESGVYVGVPAKLIK